MRKLILLFLVVLLLIVNKSLIGYVFYKTGFYSLANYFWGDTKTDFYNKWNSFYKNKDYLTAIKFYQKSTGDNLVLDYYVFHNLWNAFYRLGEKENTINNWLESVKYYEKALKTASGAKIDPKDLEQTRKNLEFVLEKLKQKQQENLNQQNKKWNNSNQSLNQNKNTWNQGSSKQENRSNNKQNSTNQANNGKNQEKSQNQSNASENKRESKQNSVWKQSNQDQNNQKDQIYQQLKQYEQRLLNEQKNLMQNYNKKLSPPNDIDDIFDRFFNGYFDDIDPFFQWLPQEREDVKDW